jgi:hypothetical protein
VPPWPWASAPRWRLLDGPASGRMAVAEAITNLAAAHVAKLTDVRLSANWMAACAKPGNEDAMLFDTVRAVGHELCSELGLTIPVGKDSLSMKTQWEEDGEGQGRGLAGVADRLRLCAGDRCRALGDAAIAPGRRFGADCWWIWAVARTVWVVPCLRRCTVAVR